MQINNNNFPSIEQVTGQYLKKSNTNAGVTGKAQNFQDVLQQTYSDLNATQADTGLSEPEIFKTCGRKIRLSAILV